MLYLQHYALCYLHVLFLCSAFPFSCSCILFCAMVFFPFIPLLCKLCYIALFHSRMLLHYGTSSISKIYYIWSLICLMTPQASALRYMENSNEMDSQMNNSSFLDMMNVGSSDINWVGTPNCGPIGEQVRMPTKKKSTKG